MATIAEMMFQSANQSVQQGPNPAESMAKGAQLGMQIEQTQQERQKLEMAKQNLLMQKINSVTDSFELAGKSTDPKLRNFLLKNVVPGKIKALGLEQYFSPQTLEMIQQSPEALDKFRGLKVELESRVSAGEISASDAFKEAAQVMQDPEALAMLDTDRLIKAQQFATTEYGKTQRVERQGQIGMGKQMQAQAAAPSTEFEKKIAEAAAKFALADKNEMQSTLEKGERSLNLLRTGKVDTGGLIKGWVAKSNIAQSSLDPETKALADDVRGLINMRQALSDPNPTEKQIDQILSRIFDPALPVEKNVQKLEDYITKTRGEMEAKQNLFIKRGFMRSEDKWTPGGERAGRQFSPSTAQKQNFKSLSVNEQDRVVQELSKRFGIKSDVVKAKLGE